MAECTSNTGPGARVLSVILLQMEADVTDVKEQLAQSLFDHIPVGVGSQGIIPTSARDLEAALEMGMDWSLREVRGRAAMRTSQLGAAQPGSSCGVALAATATRHPGRVFNECLMLSCQGYSWAEDKEHCEEYGRMLHADPSAVSQRAKKRGLPQVQSTTVRNYKACRKVMRRRPIKHYFDTHVLIEIRSFE